MLIISQRLPGQPALPVRGLGAQPEEADTTTDAIGEAEAPEESQDAASEAAESEGTGAAQSEATLAVEPEDAAVTTKGDEI